MAYLPDLSQCSYVGKNKRLTAVGWLERGFDFPRGPLETEDLRLLESSVAN